VKRARVLVLGDGKHEVGDKSAPRSAQGSEPALLCLVRRLLDSPQSFALEGDLFRTTAAAHRRGRNKYMKKTISAIRRAKSEGFAGLAIVIDRDGYRDRERIDALHEGREATEGEPSLPCALGCAVESFDAWMLADRSAIAAAGGNVDALPAHPEDMARPKEDADSVFGTVAGSGLGACYAQVAVSADLDLLR
jgi:hypothetical protein